MSRVTARVEGGPIGGQMIVLHEGGGVVYHQAGRAYHYELVRPKGLGLERASAVLTLTHETDMNVPDPELAAACDRMEGALDHISTQIDALTELNRPVV